MQKTLVLNSLIVYAALGFQARAGAIVANGGFETGDFTGWTTTAAATGSDFTVVNGPAHSGTYNAEFGASVGDYDMIQQTLTTVLGQQYVFSFWLEATGAGTSPTTAADPSVTQSLDPNGDFQAFWNGALELDSALGVAGNFGYTLFSYVVTGTGSDTILFQGYNSPDWYYLDDVSVATAGAPEPATWLLTGAGALLVGLRRRFTR